MGMDRTLYFCVSSLEREDIIFLRMWEGVLKCLFWFLLRSEVTKGLNFILAAGASKNSLYILEPSPSSDIWVENIFCQSVVWIFIFLIMFFEGKIFSILIKSNSSIFSFKDYVLGVKSKKSLSNPRSGRFFSFFQKFYRRIKLEIKKNKKCF